MHHPDPASHADAGPDISVQHVDWDRALRALEPSHDDEATVVRGLD